MVSSVSPLGIVFDRVRTVPVAVGLLGIASILLSILGSVIGQIPVIGWIGMIVILPVISAGIISLTDSVYQSYEFSLNSFLPAIERYAVSLLGAYVIYLSAAVLSVLGSIMLVIVSAGFSAMTVASAPSFDSVIASLGIGSILGVGLLFLGFATFYFIYQFVPYLIVLNDQSVKGGFTQAVSLIKTNLLSSIGYTVIRQLIVLVPPLAIGSVLGGIGFLISGFSVELYTLIPGLIGAFVGVVVSIPLQHLYDVAYISETSAQQSFNGHNSTVAESVNIS